MRLARSSFGLCALWALGTSSVLAQIGQTPAPTYTLKAESRIVLTDVTVTDAAGKPVRGLDRGQFRILDEGKPQQIVSFEEHKPQDGAAGTQNLTPDVFSNGGRTSAATVWNVIVLDTATMEVVDQMYLNNELMKFLNTLPADEPVAIYVHANDFALLVQSFTTDRELLQKALHKGIPRVQMASAVDVNEGRALDQLSQDLRTLPGRKNLLWFGSGASLFETKDPNYLPGGIDLRPVYDELEAGRIAIYPIDPRTTNLDFNNQTETGQHEQMKEEANATGGHAYFGYNNLHQIAADVLDNGRCFYTLSYAPRDVKRDNKWHHVKVEVGSGQYQLSYRTGYFDDAPGAGQDEPGAKPGRTKPRIIADVASKISQPDPILFRAKLIPVEDAADLALAGAQNAGKAVPGAPARKQAAYKLRYVVPMSAFTQEDAGDKKKVKIGVAIITYSNVGTPMSKVMNEVKLTFNAADDKPGATLGFEERVNLPQGEAHLYLAVWDVTSNRLGTLQVPVDVPKP